MQTIDPVVVSEIQGVGEAGQIGDGPQGSIIWTVDEAFEQPENPDVAFNTISSSGSTDSPLDPTILLNILNLAASILAVNPVPAVAAAGGVFALISALITMSTSESAAIESQTDDASMKTYIANLASSLTGMQDNVSLLQRLEPSTNPVLYVDTLVSLNTAVTAVMPQFQQDIYRRWATLLFMSAATIHLNTLRKLVDAAPDSKPVYTDALRSNATKYIAWLSGTKNAILDAREADIGPLVGSVVVYIKDSFHDNRLVNGSTMLINVSPATTAPASRSAYIARRRAVFAQDDWMQSIDECVLSWKQLRLLCDLNAPGTFVSKPDGAVFPGVGSGGNYLELADRVAWTGVNVLNLRVNGSWVTLNVPAVNQGLAVINVGGTSTDPLLNVTGAAINTVGLQIQKSGVWVGTSAGAGSVLMQPIASNCILSAFNIMLNPRDNGQPGQPVAAVFDSVVDANGTQTLTLRQTSAILGFAPTNYSQQSCALATPLPVQAGQLVGFINTGPHTVSANWVDGPANKILWFWASTTIGSTVTIQGANRIVPCVAAGWNFTSFADFPT